MARFLSITVSVLILAFAWFIFEYENIWPINQDRILLLRTMFATGMVATMGATLFGKSKLLPSVILATAFGLIAACSQSELDARYALQVASVLALLAGLTWIERPPIYVR